MVELLKRYSNLDTFQNSVKFLEKSLVRSDNGAFQVPSPRTPITPPEPFKLSQRLQSDVITEIVARYKAGVPSTALAAAFGISKSSIIRLLREAGVKVRKQGLTDEQIDDAVKLYAEGKSLAWIGKRLRVDHGTVWRQLRKRGVRMRDTHGRER